MAPPTDSPDVVLSQLVSQRTEEINALRKSRADRLHSAEESGRRQMNSVLEALGTDMANAVRRLERMYANDANAARSRIDELRKQLAVPATADILARERRPSFFRSNPALFLTPYYATVYASDGTIPWQGYYPGDLRVSDLATGSGIGWFGTGAQEAVAHIDWWFYFHADVSRWYSYTIHVPVDGYYIAYADDGFWTSKEAKIKLDISTVGYQYNYKASSGVTVLYQDGQNIDVNARDDNVYLAFYGDLLGGPDFAYLRVTLRLDVYARGDGSHAQINFLDGGANYVGLPWVVVV